LWNFVTKNVLTSPRMHYIKSMKHSTVQASVTLAPLLNLGHELARNRKTITNQTRRDIKNMRT